MRCPTCKQPVDRAAAGVVYPFCSNRCHGVDLGRWLLEEYRVPEESFGEPAGELGAGAAVDEGTREN